MKHQLATLTLGPILYIQGQYVRRSMVQLTEPPGSRQGSCGSGPKLRLLVLGDSAAAGVGAAHQNEALLGKLVSELSNNYTVEWMLSAETGATTTTTLTSLEHFPKKSFDVVVTSLGVNDVTSGLSRAKWKQQQAKLRMLLRESFNVKQIIVSGLPPVHGFPALPQPLRWYLGARAKQFDDDLRDAVDDEPDVTFLSLRFTKDITMMAVDGFHPGPKVYQEWGKRAATLISSQFTKLNFSPICP